MGNRGGGRGWKPGTPGRLAGSVFALWGLIFSQGSAGVLPPTLDRQYEPIVLYGGSLPELHGMRIDAIHAFSFDASTGEWRAIPFQIDEVRDGDYFNPDDSLLDADDELVLFSQDVGAQVPDGVWIPGEAARTNLRIEIEISDPLAPEKRGWVYLFVNAPDSLLANVQGYLDYDAASDRVNGRYYVVGFNEKGILVDAHITADGGGTDVDLVDRQKQRVKGNYRYGFVTYNYKATEENIEKQRIEYKLGPVRLLRRMYASLVYLNLIRQDISFLIRFYPRSFYLGGGGNISSDLGVYHIRQSLDLNANAVGMLFYNEHNEAVPIDGNQTNDNVDKTLETPAKHWMMVTGDQGTILTLVEVPRIGDVQRLYYRDSSSGTDDGTDDTGDGRSYGDIGVYVFTRGDHIITGPSSSATWTYFLPANQSAQTGQQMLAYWENPLQVRLTPQQFDVWPPGAVRDLVASSEGPGEVRLQWTATGDDGAAGTATAYDIRYSLEGPPLASSALSATGAAGDYDLESWFRDATPLPDSAAPLAAGESESRLISGLTPKTRYFFALRAVDDAGNVGPISNIAAVIVVPVELSVFTARVVGDSVLLRWSTESERNNLGFAIERRNGGGDWQSIGFVPGHGTTDERHDYRFADRPPHAGEYTYRLKQVDVGGASTYSHEIRVRFAPTVVAELTVYPNPFNAETRILLRFPGTRQVRVLIHDALGRQVSAFALQTDESGRAEFRWNGADPTGRVLPSGIYLVRATDGQRVVLTKALLIR